MKSRPAAVAGLFYPDHPTELRELVSGYLRDAKTPARADTWPKAIIAPHAGYMYSGPVAASAYALLKPARGKVSCVLLLGPAHRYPVEGLAVSSAEMFATPLGPVQVDRAAVADALTLPAVSVCDEAHAPEHALEVHLPFLMEVLGDFKVVPFAVGKATAQEVAAVLEKLWGGPETLIVISSDLSHFLHYDQAREVDGLTAKAIERLAPEDIGYHQACGRVPVNGLLTVAQKKGLRAKTVDLRNSGDTAGPRDNVVGYGAFIFEPSQ
ncbi:MAG TPA: AmmeMemoRadiSam system protein B [Planctomycetota bacterium]|nr:AmmeMemoRadiSam system protein B [Planctomycetota bacterium]